VGDLIRDDECTLILGLLSYSIYIVHRFGFDIDHPIYKRFFGVHQRKLVSCGFHHLIPGHPACDHCIRRLESNQEDKMGCASGHTNTGGFGRYQGE
jgi:hypothetical protein